MLLPFETYQLYSKLTKQIKIDEDVEIIKTSITNKTKEINKNKRLNLIETHQSIEQNPENKVSVPPKIPAAPIYTLNPS